MKIPVAQAQNHIGTVFSFRFSPTGEQLGMDNDTSRRYGSISVDGEAVHNGKSLEVRGHIHTTANFFCSRCLENAPVTLNVSFSERFAPVVQEAEEDELVRYDGDEIDITDLIRDNLILAEPLNPICADDCQGLCLVCGINLNTDTCSCDRKPADPRLAVLQKLLSPKS